MSSEKGTIDWDSLTSRHPNWIPHYTESQVDAALRQEKLMKCQAGVDENFPRFNRKGVNHQEEQQKACNVIPYFTQKHMIDRHHESKLARAICDEMGKR